MPALTVQLPPPQTDSWDWQLSAGCRNTDSAVFFHPDNERGEPRASRVRAAKLICRQCPVRALCLNHALDSHEHHGIWGGHTEDERRRLRRHRESSADISRPRNDVDISRSDLPYARTDPVRCDTARREAV